MKNFKIKSYCKINLTLRILKKLDNGYHSIMSLITFCGLHDVILISKIKGPRDKINFFGKFKKGINKKSNTITKVLNLFRSNKFLKNQSFKINVKKNIPHGSGLGGGSSNAADLMNFFNSNLKLKLSKKKIKKMANKIGFDVPINLERNNTFITGKENEILRLNKKFGFNLLIVYPNIVCSTQKIYKKNKKINIIKSKSFFYKKNKKNFINFLIKENNDLEKTIVKIYPRVKRTIDFIKFQKGCHLARITGSGSACFGIFSNMKNAINAQKLTKIKYPRYWCAVSKSI